jgi:ribosomal protein S18 acetylase RimI-like enzyme
MTTQLVFRPIRDDDQEFLYRLYASTRQDEFRWLPLDAAAQERLLRLQFTAQHQHYQQHYADASFDLILLAGQPIGRLYVRRGATELHIIDLALLPDYRGAGIGGNILRRLMTEAAATGKPVRFHVQHNNPAVRLYSRLGFRMIGDTGVHALLEWLPTEPAASIP